VTWLFAAVSLFGTWLNVRQHRACFLLWLATNAFWAHASFTHDLPAKGWLHVAYAALAIEGLRRWRPSPVAPSSA